MGYPGDGPAPPTLYPSNCRYSREAANELFTQARRRGVLGRSLPASSTQVTAKIRNIADAPAPLGRVGLRRRGGERNPRVMGYPEDGPAPPALYPSNSRYTREAANELFTESRRRISMKMSSRRAALKHGSVTQHRPQYVHPPTR